MKLLPLSAVLLGFLNSPANCGQHPESGADRSRVWLERSWEIRYLLFVEDAARMKAGAIISSKRNQMPDLAAWPKVYFHADALFSPNAEFSAPAVRVVASRILSFDEQGQLLAPEVTAMQLTGKRNLLGHLVLMDRQYPIGRPYYLAEWSQGIPGDAEFSPAVCAYPDVDRYDGSWRSGRLEGGFGCREWTVQLNHAPYIDVTSYQGKRAFIGTFVGWSRFRDPPKPVIGLHGKTWLCLHECPDGEKPGVIPDIRKWTRKHGFPMPRRPHKQPEYPNSDFKSDIEAERGN